MAFPVTINGRTYTLADFEGTNYVDGFPDALEDFVTQAGDIYNSTSTSSVAIGTGSKSFTTADSDKPYQAGTPLRIADAAAPATNFMDCIVTSYSGTSLVVESIGFGGSGTKSSWTINIGGAKTVDGTLAINQGGTGATTASAAASNLGLGTEDSPEFSGLTLTGDASFGDNDKAIFGAGDDLQIYHDGSNSFISDQGTGDLRLLAGNFRLNNSTNTENLIAADANGAVTLYYDNSSKLTTTNTGIDVTGTVSSDGLTVNKDSGTDHIEVTNGTAGSDASPQYMDITFTGFANRDMARIRGVNRSSSRQGGSVSIETSDANSTDGSTYKNRAFFDVNGDIFFYEDTGTTPKFVWDASAESLAIGNSFVDSDASSLYLLGADPTGIDKGQLVLQGTTTSGAADTGAGLTFKGHNGSGNRGFGSIQVLKENSTVGNNDTYMRFATRDNTDGYREVMRIDSSRIVTLPGGIATGGSTRSVGSNSGFRQNFGVAIEIDRGSTDGAVMWIKQDNSIEGNISVSGTTVSYNGGHLARWSQTIDDARIDGLIKGTVLSNLNEMCEWKGVEFEYQALVSEAVEAQDEVLDEEGNVIQEAVEGQDAVFETRTMFQAYDGDANVGDVIDWEYEGETFQATVIFEDNEQLNRMKISDVEGDPNVAGVFVNWDDDDVANTADMNIAMTGDMVIRIAQGTTVQRGDLLMSAGDGTAKPQGDDIVRSKTIAKVTSTHVSHTYDDGSYLVPCVLMAC